MRRLVLAVTVSLVVAAACSAQVFNLKVVTDQSPDYTDRPSLVRSVTAKWPTTKEKCWAMWYWNHFARRQTTPMNVHGLDLTDPIMQFNDYGYAMCSTISGINDGIWHAMGLEVRYWDVVGHTVSECFYDGRWHMYDDSMSAYYTLCDGTTVAGVEDLGKTLGCAASGGKEEPGHAILYHCAAATSPKGFLTGADCPRLLASEVGCFNPRRWAYRYYYNEWDWGHRYVLNLRERETYTRSYTRLDGHDPAALHDRKAYRSDPAYYVANPRVDGDLKDPESVNPRYVIRGNGEWVYKPALTPAEYFKFVDSMKSAVPVAPEGLMPAAPGTPAEVVFRINGANVITSMSVRPQWTRRGAEDYVAISVSRNNGVTWSEVWKDIGKNDIGPEAKVVGEVNGVHQALVKVTLFAKVAPTDAVLKAIEIRTITQINSKTQPKLNLGRNTIYVGAGEPTETILLWPELQGEAYKADAVETHNVVTDAKHEGWHAVIRSATPGEDAWLVYRVDAPRDITQFSMGARMYNRNEKSHVDFLYSLDAGKTWKTCYSLTDIKPPWDTIHYETIAAVPPGTRSVLFKYLWNDPKQDKLAGGLYAARMEVRFRPVDPAFKPMEVTFSWTERNGDDWGKGLVKRSHAQLVPSVPFRYVINVGGDDTPVTDSLSVNLKGAVPDVKYGYSDGKDVGGEKFVGRWETWGKDLAAGKTYTASVPSVKDYNASGDPDGNILTDGVVGPGYMWSWGLGALWKAGTNPTLTLDLGAEETCAAIGLHFIDMGDLLRGGLAARTKIEVSVSADGKDFTSIGFVDTQMKWKDIPVNFMMPDDEQVGGRCYYLLPDEPVKTRYVRYKVTSGGFFCPTELLVMDAHESKPFDLRIALPDER